MSILRFISLTIIGIVFIFYGWQFHNTPLAFDAPERTGALFKTFGQQGLVIGSIGIGFLIFIVGISGTFYKFKQIQQFHKK